MTRTDRDVDRRARRATTHRDAARVTVPHQLRQPDRPGHPARARASCATTHGTETEGWGECVALSEPSYSPEYVDGAQHVIVHHLLPRTAPGGALEAADVAPRLAKLHGHPMAKGALEMAILDAQLRANGESFASFLGATATRIPSGVSVGIHDTTDALLRHGAGLRRRRVRAHQVEDRTGLRHRAGRRRPRISSAPTRRSRSTRTPPTAAPTAPTSGGSTSSICCSSSSRSPSTTSSATPCWRPRSTRRSASTNHWCRPTAPPTRSNSGPARSPTSNRAGSVATSKPSGSTTCASPRASRCGVAACWRPGIGRAANAALAALPGFTLPGDISASTRFYAQDIVTDPITITDGHVHRADHSRPRFRPRHGVPRLGHHEPFRRRPLIYSPGHYDVPVPVR